MTTTMSAAKTVSGQNVVMLGTLQVTVEKVLDKASGIGPIEILKAVADGFEVASYPVCAGALRMLVDELTQVTSEKTQ